MLQIAIYLLCIYLVFKALEIYQIAYVSTSEHRRSALQGAALLIGLSILIAIGFWFWADSQAEAVGRNLQSAPSAMPTR